MGLTITPITRSVFGNKRVVLADVTFDSSYPTGGESITPAVLGLSDIDAIFTNGAKGWGVVYDKANAKLMAYGSTAGTEITDTTNLSALVVQILAVGS
jgi:hypothetical protein